MFDGRMMNRQALVVLRGPILHQKLVHVLRQLTHPVEPLDVHHQRVPLALEHQKREGGQGLASDQVMQTGRGGSRNKA